MDLIEKIASFVLTFIAGVLGNIVAHDICATADARCSKIIRRAAKRLADFDVEATELEWLADLNERETVREKYRHAIGCYLAAPRMRRQALTVGIAVKFKVNSVGTVPCTITIDPIFGNAVMNAIGKQSRFSTSLLMLVFVYQFGKVLVAAQRLGPGTLRRFLDEVKNFEKWDFDVKVVGKNRTLDLSKIAKLYALDKQAGLKFLKQYSEILSTPAGDVKAG
jgi:hypothetical protein